MQFFISYVTLSSFVLLLSLERRSVPFYDFRLFCYTMSPRELELNFIYSRLNPTAQSTTALSSSKTFACRCSSTANNSTASSNLPPNVSDPAAVKPDLPKAMPKQPNLKGIQSDLSRYFGGISVLKKDSPSTAVTASTLIGDTPTNNKSKASGAGCGGTIKVEVQDDLSHPLGIHGHRVLLWIEH
jgi:hypothetical protein